MRSRPFVQCDVFTDIPTKGNALAVVLDAEGLSDNDMSSFAAWTNLAETTFLFPSVDPRADYHLRIFTPQREMPFAGHPTLGSCAAWLKAGGKPNFPGVVRQECGVGIVDIELGGSAMAFVAPPTQINPLPVTDCERILAKLDIKGSAVVNTARLDNGPVWQVFELRSADDVLAVDSARVKWPDEKAIGLVGAYGNESEFDYEVRMLAPSSGMSEDPITGSLNSALSHWFQQQNKLPPKLLMAQGTTIGREGRVHISRDAHNVDRILIGGHTQILIEGSVML